MKMSDQMANSANYSGGEVSSQLVQNKISAGSVAAFGQSLRTFVPEFQVCPPRGAFDYAGRDAPSDSINTQGCPGTYPSSLRIEVENSLRSFVSPTYFNLPIGITGGADTMFGQTSTSRQQGFAPSAEDWSILGYMPQAQKNINIGGQSYRGV